MPNYRGSLSTVFSQLLVETLLFTQPHDYSSQIDAPAPAATSRTIRAAVDFINEDPAAISTVTDIARAAMVSVRSLEYGFRKHLGVSPMSYVREVRLARVYDELKTGDPSRLTVTAAARRCGSLSGGSASSIRRSTTSYRHKPFATNDISDRGNVATDGHCIAPIGYLIELISP